MKAKILQRRRSIFDNLKKKALAFEQRNTQIDKYLADQTDCSTREFTLSSIEDLKKNILCSDIILLGDYHTFDQNIQNAIRIIKILLEDKNQFFIGIEMVHYKKQICIDAYLEGHLTEFEFLDSIDYHKTWKFPWTHYKKIFDLAKQHQIPLLALNKAGSLQQRDQYCAKVLEQNKDLLDKAKALILYGELHIVENKIPREIAKVFPQKKQVIIHQNLDEVYWNSDKETNESVVYQFNPTEYCILSAPPWIKYESMLYWYENLYNDPDYDLHEYIIETGKKFFSDDTQDNFLNLSLEMKRITGLRIKDEEIDNFNLYDHTSIEHIEEKIDELPDGIQAYYWDLLRNGKSFKLPFEFTYYCSSYSINRISYLAGIHLFYTYQDLSPNKYLKSLASLDSFFIKHVFESCFAYFFSKIINPHRKCDLYLDLKNSALSPKMKFILNFLEYQFDFISLNKLDKFEIRKAALHLGHFIGEYLYLKAYKGTISPQRIEEFLLLEMSAPNLEILMKEILFDIDFKQHNKRYF